MVIEEFGTVGVIIFLVFTVTGKIIISGSPVNIVSEKTKEYFIDPILLKPGVDVV